MMGDDGEGQSTSDSTVPTLAQRLEKLDGAQREISQTLLYAQGVFNEMAKDKPVTKGRMDEAVSHFRNSLKSVERELSLQLDYMKNVCVGSAHLYSTFAAVQNERMAEGAQVALNDELGNALQRHFPKSAPTDQQ